MMLARIYTEITELSLGYKAVAREATERYDNLRTHYEHLLDCKFFECSRKTPCRCRATFTVENNTTTQ